MCRTQGGNVCTDHAPRTIEVEGVIDFRAADGYASARGCYTGQQCAAPKKTEVMLLVTPSGAYHRDGKPGNGMYQYSVAGLRPLTVGSNKTLIGVGATAGIKGKGLMLHYGISNVVVRNLAFTDINQGPIFGGDAITIINASKLWIDHIYFARIGRQMLVSGDGSGSALATDVTISNNEFDGRNHYSPDCKGKHYWTLLLAGTHRMTFQGNWLHDFSGPPCTQDQRRQGIARARGEQPVRELI